MKRFALLLALVIVAAVAPAWVAAEGSEEKSSTESATSEQANFDGQYRCDTCHKHPKDGKCQKCGKLTWGCPECGQACVKKEPCGKCGKEYVRIQEDDAPTY